MSTITIQAKDLTQEAPRSPRIRLGGYVILGRTIDKCRALLAEKIGVYHFDCPLDNQLFGFKGIKGDDFKKEVETGASDNEVAEWVNKHGVQKTPDEIKKWSDDTEKYSMGNDPNPEKKDFFIGECKKLWLDPNKATLFDWLEEDDRVSFKK